MKTERKKKEGKDFVKSQYDVARLDRLVAVEGSRGGAAVLFVQESSEREDSGKGGERGGKKKKGEIFSQQQPFLGFKRYISISTYRRKRDGEGEEKKKERVLSSTFSAVDNQDERKRATSICFSRGKKKKNFS